MGSLVTGNQTEPQTQAQGVLCCAVLCCAVAAAVLSARATVLMPEMDPASLSQVRGHVPEGLPEVLAGFQGFRVLWCCGVRCMWCRVPRASRDGVDVVVVSWACPGLHTGGMMPTCLFSCARDKLCQRHDQWYH
jgi:hypothetical protein